MRILAIGLVFGLDLALLQGSPTAEAAQKAKVQKATPKTGSMGSTVTGRFGLKTYDVNDPAPRAGRKKAKGGKQGSGPVGTYNIQQAWPTKQREADLVVTDFGRCGVAAELC